MREIKFRAWDIRRNRMAYNVEQEYDTIAGIRFENTNIEPGERCFNSYLKLPYIVMQYTGLKDKNGKEIYEGDIVRYIDENWRKRYERKQVVAYSTDRFCDGEYGYSMGIGFNVSWDENTECEIIGNIYENPGILEEKPHESR